MTTDINKKIIEEATRYCENVKYVRKLDKYFSDLQRDFKALTSKLPDLLNRELINKDEFLFDLEISMDDLAVQIQSAMFKVQQQDLLYNKGARGAEALDAEALAKELLPLFFTYLMAVDKNSIINKQNFGMNNTFNSLLQQQSTPVNNNVGNIGNISNNGNNGNNGNNDNSTDVFIPPFIELD
jgi:hypothetical protein